MTPRTTAKVIHRNQRERKMLDGKPFRKALEKHFRFIGGLDNLPELCTSLYRRRADGMGRKALALTMNDMGLKKGVEIGCRYGASALLWKEFIPDLNLTCIDPYAAYHRVSQERQDEIYEGIKKNLEGSGIEILRRFSLDAVQLFKDGSLDWVHIDGDHSFDAAVQDIIRWAPKVREGGLVLVHDYCAFGMSGVMPAVDAYTHCHRIDPWYVTRDMEPTAFWQRGAERAGLGS
jgi:predicted O-methyltransferase YrrM